LLLRNLEGVEDRAANFTCAVALVGPDGREHAFVGKCFGRIALAPSGAEGFGYDPLFVPDGYDKSFAELSADEKNAISHRGRALEKVKAIVGDGSAGDGSRVEHAERAEGKGGSRVLAWLRLFRVVNLPTVPGDVLVGAASVLCWGADAAISSRYAQVIAAASLASVFLYMFGLVDNDIVGAKGDRGRPIPDGEISIGAARIARGLCLFAALIVGAAANLQSDWWIASFLLAMSVVIYNRTKLSLFMGLCRGLNVLSGAVVVGMCGIELAALALVAPLVWTLYITVVTWYSTGEENDPDKKRRVGLLVGGIVYLQLAALIYLTMKGASVMPLLVAGAVLLVVLRLMKRLLPRVSAS
jgi:4-hydroxybenzoate polyprenyltransferase